MQDALPQGLKTITYKRNLPKRGPSGLVVLAAAFGVMTYGFIEFSKDNQERRFYKLMIENYEERKFGQEYTWFRYCRLKLIEIPFVDLMLQLKGNKKS
jgi:hypothetical protein